MLYLHSPILSGGTPNPKHCGLIEKLSIAYSDFVPNAFDAENIMAYLKKKLSLKTFANVFISAQLKCYKCTKPFSLSN